MLGSATTVLPVVVFVGGVQWTDLRLGYLAAGLHVWVDGGRNLLFDNVVHHIGVDVDGLWFEEVPCRVYGNEVAEFESEGRKAGFSLGLIMWTK